MLTPRITRLFPTGASSDAEERKEGLQHAVGEWGDDADLWRYWRSPGRDPVGLGRGRGEGGVGGI